MVVYGEEKKYHTEIILEDEAKADNTMVNNQEDLLNKLSD